MAYEATLFIETELPIPMICADGNSITQGSAVKLTDPFTVAITAAASDLCGGIIAGDKIASDGVTTIGVYRGGYFKVTLSGSCTVGDPATTDSVVNMFKAAPLGLSGQKIWGTFLETGTTGQTVIMHLNPQNGGSGPQ